LLLPFYLRFKLALASCAISNLLLYITVQDGGRGLLKRNEYPREFSNGSTFAVVRAPE
jgi:hypothetical protein